MTGSISSLKNCGARRGADRGPARRAPDAVCLSAGVPLISEEDRITIERRFRVIEPLLHRSRFKAIWEKNGNRTVRTVHWLAKRYKTKPRTIYNWLDRWYLGGVLALARKTRRDKGTPRLLNDAVIDFLKHPHSPDLNVASAYRAYLKESQMREDLPVICYSTFRSWHHSFVRGLSQ